MYYVRCCCCCTVTRRGADGLLFQWAVQGTCYAVDGPTCPGPEHRNRRNWSKEKAVIERGCGSTVLHLCDAWTVVASIHALSGMRDAVPRGRPAYVMTSLLPYSVEGRGNKPLA